MTKQATLKLLLSLSLLGLMAGCPEQGISQKVTINQPGTASAVNRKPIIQQLNANPNNISRKDDIISFKVVAVDEDGDILKYVWSATKGTISSTQGEIVTWMPQKSDGSLEAGTAVISVLVSDNKGGTDTSSVNIRIDASGSAQVQGGSAPAPSATPVPTAQPSLAPTPLPTQLPTALPTAQASVSTPPMVAPTETLIYSNGNIAAVYNNPICRPRFSLSQNTRITKIINYHWNQAQGDPPGNDGAISLQSDDGTTFGPWKIAGTRLGQGGVPNAYWDVFPNQELPAGSYTVLDTHQATWAQNSGSSGCGMTEVYGYGTAMRQGNLIFNNWNIAYVDNGPTGETRFTLTVPQRISYLDTYHWNYGKGSPGGTLALKGTDGKLYGPWPVTTGPGQGGVPNALWITRPYQLLPAGTYTVIDSEPSTWSQNAESGQLGFARVEGLPE